MKTKLEPRRHPRPMGLTEMVTQYHKEPSPELKTKKQNQIQKHIIQIYIANDMKLNDEPMKVNELAKYLNTNPIQILKQIQEGIQRISNFMGMQDHKAYTRVLNFRAHILGLDLQGIGTQQVEVLARAQGKKYVPFLSSSLNQAIGNLNGIFKSQLELLRVAHEADRPMPGINDDKEFGNTGTQYLTPDQALKILENQPSLQDNTDYLEQKKKAIGALPDICARNQDLESMGIGLDKTIIIPIIKPIPLNPTEAKATDRMAHESRRDHNPDIE
jgi:hypothetical protein